MDSDQITQKLKELAETAEGLFTFAKERVSDVVRETTGGSSEGDKAVDTQVLLNALEGMVKEYVDPMVKSYLERHIDFKSQVEVKLKRLENFKGNIPQYESSGASGMDVRAQLTEPLTIKPSERVLVPTGLSMEVPEEYEIQARPRSGLSLKKGLTLVNTPGTIDADYRGEIKMIMINLGTDSVTIEDQERIAQLVICPVVKAKFILADDLTDTSRGEGGFGSTGSH